MPLTSRQDGRRKFSFGLVLMLVFLTLVWLAGGASRADVIGQVVVRATAFVSLIVAVLFLNPRPYSDIRPVATFLTTIAAIVAAQMIPLPTELWTMIPGRKIFIEAATSAGLPQPWRPVSIAPSLTLNALISLIVPLVAATLFSVLSRSEQRRLAGALLILMVVSALIGLLQFAGGRFDHPLLNDVKGQVSSTFANRNHFALFIATGCVLAPTWAIFSSMASAWRIILCGALLMLFLLVILATGSRMGVAAGVGATLLSLAAFQQPISAMLADLPRRRRLMTVIAALLLVISLVGLTIYLGRAYALERMLSLDVETDMRSRALPIMADMAKGFLPFGSGFGTFDPAYRIFEPDQLLSYNYLNHAHIDPLEWIIEGGLASLMLLAIAIVWWCVTTIRIFKIEVMASLTGRAGAIILLVVGLAGLSDYALRTPMIMAVCVIASGWMYASLAGRRDDQGNRSR